MGAPSRIIGLLLAAALALPAAADTAAQPAPAGAGRQAQAIPQWAGYWGAGNGFRGEVARDAGQWEALWRQLHMNPPAPFDPASSMAVLVSVGLRNTGGYSVRVVGTREGAGKLVVVYRESRPRPGAPVLQALTHPWVIAVLPRSSLEVAFEPEAGGS